MKRFFIVPILVLIISTVSKSTFGQTFNDEIYKFSKALRYVNELYVDSVKSDKLVEDAIVGMLKELDPHSQYISKKNVEKMNERFQGSFVGIGVQFNIMKDTLWVVSPISGGPSEKVGIMSGDQIIYIDTELVAGIGLTSEMVFDKLKGEKGTKVNLKIKRQGEKELIDFEIIRDKIPIYSLDAYYVADKKNKVGYIKLNRFARTSIDEYNDAIDKLKKQGVENLILDLSGNGGGLLNIAHELADEFLESGQMIVYTEGLKSPRTDLKATKVGKMESGKVVVMIDEGSASASEIVSGAIQDWDRGVLVGRRSFGKGLVQRRINLPGGSMMHLTNARYYTPTGRLIQKSYAKGTKEYHKDLINRYNNGELSHKDSIHFPKSEKFSTLKSKRTVYGGGGIMPDIFVPIDTTYFSDYYRNLIRKGILNRFVLQYANKHNTELTSIYKTQNKQKGFDTFIKENQTTDEFMKEFLAFAEEQKLEFNKEEYKRSEDLIKTNIKALIARNIWGNSEFFQIINKTDPIYNKAISVITDDNLYKSKLTQK